MVIAFFKIYDGRINFDDYHYAFKDSIFDVLCLTVIRTSFIIVQAAWIHASKMAKIAGYTALISFMLLTIKACICIRWHLDDNNNQDASLASYSAVIIIISLVFSLMESFSELFVGIFSCATKTDEQGNGHIGSSNNTARIAPTVDANAEGINVGNTKSIGLIELFKVLRPYFWPGKINLFQSHHSLLVIYHHSHLVVHLIFLFYSRRFR